MAVAPPRATETSRCRRCGGAERDWAIVHTARRGEHTVLIDGVPAQVCFACGATRISDAVARRIESLLDEHPVESTLPFKEWRE